MRNEEPYITSTGTRSIDTVNELSFNTELIVLLSVKGTVKLTSECTRLLWYKLDHKCKSSCTKLRFFHPASGMRPESYSLCYILQLRLSHSQFHTCCSKRKLQQPQTFANILQCKCKINVLNLLIVLSILYNTEAWKFTGGFARKRLRYKYISNLLIILTFVIVCLSNSP